MFKLTKTYPKKRAFITGAASGLGKALAHHLASDGWTIGITDVHKDELNVTKREIEERGGKAFTYVFDVSEKEAYAKVAEDFLLNNEGIDLLINNAGVGDGGVFHDYNLDNWDWMVSINQMGVVYGCFHFINAFRQQQSGHIINIASAAAFSNAPRMATYSATKAAVYSLSETLKYEYHFDNIKVSVVMPTFFKTNIMQHARGNGGDHSQALELMEKSKISAKEVANEVLVKAGKGKFKIVLPQEARTGYFLKRFFPILFEKIIISRLRTNQEVGK